MDHDNLDHDKGSFFSSRANIALVGFLAIAGFFLLSEHRAHLTPFLVYLPFVLVLACPLLHVFMHGGHRNHGASETSGGGSSEIQKSGPHQH